MTARNMCGFNFKDLGNGIPPEMVDKIFEPFFLKNTDEGTGLGFSICHGIKKQRIHARSNRTWTPRRAIFYIHPTGENGTSVSCFNYNVLSVK